MLFGKKNDKPTSASVTSKPCKCNYLHNSAEDASNPIRFDERTGEFEFTSGENMWVIYHCPFCGGAAPKSKRDLLFASISTAERTRLCDLAAPLKTAEQVIEAFGLPDWESHSTSSTPEKDGTPPKTELHRMLTYENLSEVAEVQFSEMDDGKVYMTLCGKLLSRSES